jgi:adenine phosphoribosyltransferase
VRLLQLLPSNEYYLNPPGPQFSLFFEMSSNPQSQSNPPLDPSYTAPIPQQSDNAKGRLPSSTSASAAELSSLKISLRNSLRQFPDFPTPGVIFEDILPIFADHKLHESLQRALELHIKEAYGEANKPDVIVGLDARGFLFGPTLALRLGAAFVPVRKRGKLPGPTETASFKKEYGEDFFQIQKDGIMAGQKVLIVDDIIATGTLESLQYSHRTELIIHRWFRCSCRIARHKTWWKSAWLHLHPRVRLPQGPRQAQCACLHPSYQPRREELRT